MYTDIILALANHVTWLFAFCDEGSGGQHMHCLLLTRHLLM